MYKDIYYENGRDKSKGFVNYDEALGFAKLKGYDGITPYVKIQGIIK